jgi:hypothetical protein
MAIRAANRRSQLFTHLAGEGERLAVSSRQGRTRCSRRLSQDPRAPLADPRTYFTGRRRRCALSLRVPLSGSLGSDRQRRGRGRGVEPGGARGRDRAGGRKPPGRQVSVHRRDLGGDTVGLVGPGRRWSDLPQRRRGAKHDVSTQSLRVTPSMAATMGAWKSFPGLSSPRSIAGPSR